MTLLKRLAGPVIFACTPVLLLGAQTTTSARFLDVGSESERVLRVLQVMGDVPLYPWSIRQFSPRELDRLTPGTLSHTALLPAQSKVHAFGALEVELLPVESKAIFNSAFPYGYNDGPVWAGRGFTGSVSGGVAGRAGPLSFQLEPMVFDAQNTSFTLKANGLPNNPFEDGFYPGAIDDPQRFGNTAYRRFDLGQSSIRLDVGPVAAELSNADQWWGPALEHPLILGDNAPGFLHASLGSAHPIDIGIGQLHGRLVWGRLEQSAYSPDQGPDSIRFMSGVIGEFIPRGAPGLEIGAARFFHSQWPTNGIWSAPFLRPLGGLLKSQLATGTNPSGDDPGDNQLAEVFFRWVFPASGVEFYGEYGREDNNVDVRDLVQEPDHDAGYTLGLQKTWRIGASGVVALRGEVINTRLSTLYQGRGQAAWYLHAETLTQGHTDLGQFLGSPAGYGGGGGTIGIDFFSASGRWTVEWDRQMRAEARGSDGGPIALGADVIHAIGIERVQSLGRISLSGGLRGAWDLNRDFVSDRFNVNAVAGVQTHW